jgi:hypothetical protein
MTPLFWVEMMQQVFNTSERFDCQLWKHYDASATFLFQLGLCDAHAASRDLLVARVRRLSELMPGSKLLQASLAVSPETGRPRHKDAVDFEEMVLRSLDCDGRWRW